MPPQESTHLSRRGSLRAEIVCAAWETFSALLFASAVVPSALASPWPAVVFAATLVASAFALGHLARRGERGLWLASALRVLAWTVALLPLPARGDVRTWVATVTFGLMAGAIRQAIYRREIGTPLEGAAEHAVWLRGRLGESAMLAGILGGHALLLFAVAFLRAGSDVVFRGWWQLLPVLALGATVIYTLAMRRMTRDVARTLDRGSAERVDDVVSAIRSLRRLPARLSWLNFSLWIACTSTGVFYFRMGAGAWRWPDALLQLAYVTLFAWGVAFYQRGWDRDTAAQVERILARRAGLDVLSEDVAEAPGYARLAIRERMLRDFGWPLVFAAVLMLLSSISLYRSFGSGVAAREEDAAVLAQVASFIMLALAVGGVIARVARELSRPLVQVAQAAEVVAGGTLGASMPRALGPSEVAKLAASVERMRDNLARTIAELEEERASLETKVEARTRELQKALEDLRAAQAALVLTERLASIGELVAGVAHEIGNPLNAVAGSAEPLGEVVADVRAMLDAYRAAEADLGAARRAEVAALREKLDIDASLDDLEGIAAVIKRATERTVRIVQNLKSFARTTGDAEPSDLHEGLEETLTLLSPRLKAAGVEVVKVLGDLGSVVCRAGEINQVFMNVVMNAIQSLETNDPGKPRTIVIQTRRRGDTAEVSITDSGPGVPEDLERRIFDPFFTTKPPGQGTGLGLSISTDIVRKHGGTLVVERPDEGGARLVLRLPVAPADASGSKAAAPLARAGGKRATMDVG